MSRLPARIAFALSRPALARRVDIGLKVLVASAAVVYALFPVAWIVSAALGPSNSLVNFLRLVNDPQHPFLLWIWNSIKISGISAILIVSLTALAAYSFSRFRYRGRRTGLLFILLVQLFPNTLALVALFLLLRQLGEITPWLGLNSHGGLILIYTGGALGFNTWLMKGYFDTVPRDLDESALVDGASPLQAFWYVLLPLVRPILAVIGVLTFIGTYSDFLLARVMLKSTENYTLAVGMTLFIRGQYTQEWGVFAAAALVGALPIVLIFLVLQRQLVGGLPPIASPRRSSPTRDARPAGVSLWPHVLPAAGRPRSSFRMILRSCATTSNSPTARSSVSGVSSRASSSRSTASGTSATSRSPSSIQRMCLRRGRGVRSPTRSSRTASRSATRHGSATAATSTAKTPSTCVGASGRSGRPGAATSSAGIWRASLRSSTTSPSSA